MASDWRALGVFRDIDLNGNDGPSRAAKTPFQGASFTSFSLFGTSLQPNGFAQKPFGIETVTLCHASASSIKFWRTAVDVWPVGAAHDQCICPNESDTLLWWPNNAA